jgi:hypothetical protein
MMIVVVSSDFFRLVFLTGTRRTRNLCIPVGLGRRHLVATAAFGTSEKERKRKWPTTTTTTTDGTVTSNHSSF